MGSIPSALPPSGPSVRPSGWPDPSYRRQSPPERFLRSLRPFVSFKCTPSTGRWAIALKLRQDPGAVYTRNPRPGYACFAALRWLPGFALSACWLGSIPHDPPSPKSGTSDLASGTNGLFNQQPGSMSAVDVFRTYYRGG